MEKAYFRRVDLLLSILPDVLQDARLALKGGTAINLFVFDMPRLSIDIDLTYLPIEERSTTLAFIDLIFMDIRNRLSKKGFRVSPKFTADHHLKQLVVMSEYELIKIEINSVLRGCVYPPVYKNLTPRAVEEFKKSMSVQCLSDHDLFAGKICAALDRQHPRDLYDIYYFLENKQYTRALHNAFLVYLISSNRRISDLIRPNRLDIAHLYTNEFKGMTEEEIPLKALYTAFSKI